MSAVRTPSFISREPLEEKARAIAHEREAQISARAKIPRVSVDEIDFDGTRERLQDGLALLRQKRGPFVPANKTEEEFIEALQRPVLGIDLCFSGRPPGRVGLKVAVQFERLFLTDAQVRALGVTPVLLETEFIIPHYFHSYTGSMDYMSGLAAKGVHALTDDQWALLAPKLPDLRRTEHNGDRPH